MGRARYNVSDLIWYFNDAAGELGPKVQQYEPSSRSTVLSFSISVAQSRSASRYARIDELVRSLRAPHAEVLTRWYAVGHYPLLVRAHLGVHAGVALLTGQVNGVVNGVPGRRQDPADVLRDLCARAGYACPDTRKFKVCAGNGHPCRARRRDAKDTISSIVAQADKLVTVAHEEYDLVEVRRLAADRARPRQRTDAHLQVLLGIIK